MTTEHVTPAVYYELPPAQLSTIDVLDEVMTERRRQDAKWGPIDDQPWNAGRIKPIHYLLDKPWINADQVKMYVEQEARHGQLGYAEILFEEFAEALDEDDIARVREELIQVAAVAVKACEAIDRNGR